MFDLIPWLDETYIVEMGRLFLDGCSDGVSTLLGILNVPLRPLNYIGPLLQELLFRCFGQTGVRISPYVGLFVAFYCWDRRLQQENISVKHRLLLSLLMLFSHLLFQSSLLTRIDTWSLACVFAALAFLGPPNIIKSKIRIFGGAFFAVLSCFVWPTAAILFVMYPVFCFDRSSFKNFLVFCGFSLLSLIILIFPILFNLSDFLLAFSRHYREVTTPSLSLLSIVMPFAREVARSPLIALLSVIGFMVWIKEKKIAKIFSFLLVVGIFAEAGLYSFRIVYLVPFFFFMCLDATKFYAKRHSRFVNNYLCVAVIYGILTGPIGHFALSYPTLPKNLKAKLASEVGVGPIKVFAPDHATYYIGRELGWCQIGFARPSDLSNTNILNSVLAKCDAAVLRDFDPYTPFQQSFTPYGLFCKYALHEANRQSYLPDKRKSRVAKFGESFSFSWHAPFVLEGFQETAKFDMIRVYKRIHTK